MDQNNFPQQNNTQVPPPPSPEVGIRTMQSDNQAINQGQITPEPQLVSPQMNPMPNFTPETSALGGDANAMAALEAPKKSPKLLWIIIGVVVLIGLGLIGYYVIYPLFGSQPIAEPVAQAPVESNLPTPTETPAQTPALTHTSAFVVAPTALTSAALTAVSAEFIRASFTTQAAAMANGDLVEIALTTGEPVGPVKTSELIPALMPSFLDSDQVGTFLADDLTAFIYKNDKGAWPGYVFMLKEGVDTTLFAQWLASFEQNNLDNFFVSAPGALAAFKGGEVNGVTDRYASGANGASFGYAIVGGNKLLISTSYDGIKEALRLLGI